MSEIKTFFSLDKFINYCKLQYNEFNINLLETKLSKTIKFLKFTNLTKINTSVKYPEIYITYWIDNKLVGYLKLITLYNYINLLEPMRTVSTISVDIKHRTQGIAKSLIKYMFNFLLENKINDKLYISSYSEDGYNYIKHILEKYKMNFIINDNNKIHIWN